MVAQSESPIANKREVTLMYSMLKKVFPIVNSYVAPIPTYPGGYWSWAYCSVDNKPLEYINESLAKEIEKNTKFYNREIHKSIFSLPNFVKELVENKDSVKC
jgi:spermidine synthase